MSDNSVTLTNALLLIQWLTFPGSGAGWNSSLSQSLNFTESLNALGYNKPVRPAGYSAELGWFGGIRCRPGSYQYGGFGGGGAGCKGGGGGGGFVGQCPQYKQHCCRHSGARVLVATTVRAAHELPLLAILPHANAHDCRE